MLNKFDNISEDILVINIRNDNKDAFKALYDRYSRKLFYYSLKYLDNHEEAQELIQTVFINLWESRKSLNENMPVKNYIFKCAINYIYNYLRKKAIRARFIESEMKKGETYSNLTYEKIFYHDLERSVNSIVENLPSQQQNIFQLSRFGGLTHEEIAKKLNLSVRTVENQVYRALKVIKEKLKD